MSECAQKTKETGWEWGTQILMLPNKKFIYLPISTDKRPDRWSPGMVLASTVAVVHSHTKTYDNSSELFSDADKKLGDDNKINVYLVTPNGQRKKYANDPEKKRRGQITIWDPRRNKWNPGKR